MNSSEECLLSTIMSKIIAKISVILLKTMSRQSLQGGGGGIIYWLKTPRIAWKVLISSQKIWFYIRMQNRLNQKIRGRA